MRYPNSILDEIRARLPVSAVVGRKVRLKKAGREWKGLSPFNAEKTPSFYVNDQKGFYHCFSSGKHGDIFTFLIETEGLTFPEAVDRLAAEAGVSLPKHSAEAVAQEEKRKTLYDVVELACRFFEGQLQTSKGSDAREYLVTRQISLETQAEFRIGFAPDSRTALVEHLRSKGVDDEQTINAGLAIRPEDGRGIYDRFRGRVIIPIQDRAGRVIAFGGRALSPDMQPKYLNSPETALFQKGRTLFNAHRARRFFSQANAQPTSAIVVEGYLDAIAVYQAGLKCVVATLGTAFSEDQIASLWAFAAEPVICFDGDRAGRAAAYRAIDRILPVLKTGSTFRFTFLPSGQDPDDLIRNAGVEALATLIDGASSFWDVLWTREVEQARLDDPNGQAVFENRIKQLVGAITDETLRRRFELSARLQISDFLWKLGKRQATERLSRDTAVLKLPDLVSAGATQLIGLERVFLGMCVHFPDLFEHHRERIAQMKFRGHYKDTKFQAFVGDLLRIIGDYEVHDCRVFYNWMEDSFFDTLDYLHGRRRMHNGFELPWGHNLYARIPVLQCPVPERFVEECFQNFLEILWLRDVKDEVASAGNNMDAHLAGTPGQSEEAFFRWLVGQQRAVHETQERVIHKELELAEEAAAYTSASGRPFRIAADPRGVTLGRSHPLLTQAPEPVSDEA